VVRVAEHAEVTVSAAGVDTEDGVGPWRVRLELEVGVLGRLDTETVLFCIDRNL
jgi:hypothetical protein